MQARLRQLFHQFDYSEAAFRQKKKLVKSIHIIDLQVAIPHGKNKLLKVKALNLKLVILNVKA